MRVERAFGVIAGAVGLALRDYVRVVFFDGYTQREAEDIKDALAGYIRDSYRKTYKDSRLRTAGLHKEPSLITDGWLVSVSGTREVQDPRAVELERARLGALTPEQLDEEVRRDALRRIRTGSGVWGINPDDYRDHR